ncbi:transcription factor 24-like isoform X3 [Daphnia pulicaria]|uniref:transcription factor 24-like isoform X3 n=1 Tax=Daphnia pulicaria TaxID=35523 RepID=UPI001EEB342C|nr:transcription factor 24-like isoform X3 [Daphnia pulicaria]
MGSRRPNAARERSRVQNLRDAFQSLQSALPAVPPSTKLSKLDVLLMASAYIAHLGRLVQVDNDGGDQQQPQPQQPTNFNSNDGATFHPVKKWPMRARLYAGLNHSGSHRPLRPDEGLPTSSFRR